MPKLFIVEDGNEAVYEIFENEVTLGRGAANAVQVADSHASKNHATIRCVLDHWKVIDLESRNGTRVNGKFRNQAWLSEGDTITIGTAVLRYSAEGAPEGVPGTAVEAERPVAAKPVAARPAVARRPAVGAAPAVPAAPAVAEPASAPTRAVAPAPARSAPARAPARRAGAAPAGGRRRAGRDDRYEEDYGDEGRPQRRRRSNSGPIAIIGILAAAVFVVVMFAMFAGGMEHNQEVLIAADKMADKGFYLKALQYAEQRADPDGKHYLKLLKKMDEWKARHQAKLDQARGMEAREYFRIEIFQQQAITENFRAKNALPDDEVVRLLREFLKKYKGTQTATEILFNEYSGYPELRDAMRQHASPDLKANDVLGAIQADIALARSARMFGKAVMDLEYLRDVNRLCMTPENFKELRAAVQAKIDEIKSDASRAFQEDRRKVEGFRSNGQKGQARRLLRKMHEYYKGIPELIREVKALEQKL